MINTTSHKTVLAVVLAATLITLPFYAAAKDDMMMKDGKKDDMMKDTKKDKMMKDSHEDTMRKKDEMMKDGK